MHEKYCFTLNLCVFFLAMKAVGFQLLRFCEEKALCRYMRVAYYRTAGKCSWTKISPQPNYLCNTLQKYSVGINFHPWGKGHHRLYNIIINTEQKKQKKKKTHGIRVSPMRAQGKKRQKFSPGKNSGYTILCYWSSSF